jgi:hypothetical protein
LTVSVAFYKRLELCGSLLGASARRTQPVVENVGVTFTPRSVVDDRWQEGFFLSGPHFFCNFGRIFLFERV